MDKSSEVLYENNLRILYDMLKGHSISDSIRLLDTIDFLIKVRINFNKVAPKDDHRIAKGFVRLASTSVLECLHNDWGVKQEDTTFIWEIVWYEVKKALEEEREVG